MQVAPELNSLFLGSLVLQTLHPLFSHFDIIYAFIVACAGVSVLGVGSLSSDQKLALTPTEMLGQSMISCPISTPHMKITYAKTLLIGFGFTIDGSVLTEQKSTQKMSICLIKFKSLWI